MPGDHSRLTEEQINTIAVLAVQTVGLDELLEVEMPAEAEQLATIRHLIRRWVEANDGSDDDCAAFAIAVSEACANAIEHAYGPRGCEDRDPRGARRRRGDGRDSRPGAWRSLVGKPRQRNSDHARVHG